MAAAELAANRAGRMLNGFIHNSIGKHGICFVCRVGTLCMVTTFALRMCIIQLDMREREFQSFSPPATLDIYLIVFARGKWASTKTNSLFFKKAVQGGRALKKERK